MTTPDPNQPIITAAVQRCLDAYHHELAIPRPKDGTDHSSKTYARKAYRNAMPFLSSPANIDAFIACVAHGLLINAIRGDDASKLLYAAQVAIASRRLQQKPVQQPRGPHGQVFVRGVESRGPHGQVFVRGAEQKPTHPLPQSDAKPE